LGTRVERTVQPRRSSSQGVLGGEKQARMTVLNKETIWGRSGGGRAYLRKQGNSCAAIREIGDERGKRVASDRTD